MPTDQKLKTLRQYRGITIRSVEQASRRIAEAKGDKRFRISNGWLTQLENSVSEPSIWKLFSLSTIYHVNFLDLMRLYGVDIDEIEEFEHIANPSLTQLVSKAARVPALESSGVETTLLPLEGDHVSSILKGQIGTEDFTMYPLIRPGSLVYVDTAQSRVQQAGWHNEYERPIYFIELRNAFACGWCEEDGNELRIIPHQSSPASSRRFNYPRDAEILGRVISFETRCVDDEEIVLKAKARSKKAHGR